MLCMMVVVVLIIVGPGLSLEACRGSGRGGSRWGGRSRCRGCGAGGSAPGSSCGGHGSGIFGDGRRGHTRSRHALLWLLCVGFRVTHDGRCGDVWLKMLATRRFYSKELRANHEGWLFMFARRGVCRGGQGSLVDGLLGQSEYSMQQANDTRRIIDVRSGGKSENDRQRSTWQKGGGGCVCRIALGILGYLHTRIFGDGGGLDGGCGRVIQMSTIEGKGKCKSGTLC